MQDRFGNLRLTGLKMHLFVLMAVVPSTSVDEYGCSGLLSRAFGFGLGGCSLWTRSRGLSIPCGLGLPHQAIVPRSLLFSAGLFHPAWQGT